MCPMLNEVESFWFWILILWLRGIRLFWVWKYLHGYFIIYFNLMIVRFSLQYCRVSRCRGCNDDGDELGGLDFSQLCKVYLFISSQRIAGLVAEPIKEAFEVLSYPVGERQDGAIAKRRRSNPSKLQFGKLF
ncbi:hypothetical protein J1N35_046093 [Gossypium stocksii]|uniref:Uncharacterized protein n=1 Tax=Gossypium stocksii TaxID=47602 RepID=A0A9D3U5I7_9ROSI|nr:hypothetical protein J1N35_046093 [Gossypium stocksii]